MVEINNKTREKINSKMIKAVVNKFFAHYKIKKKSISIALVGDRTMAKLNKIYRKEGGPTDVLAFAGEGNFFGEIIIDLPQIKRQAKIYKKSAEKELVFIVTHGLLHLNGYDDKTEKEKEKIINKGREFIAWLENKRAGKLR